MGTNDLRSGFAAVDGAHLYYETAGSGPGVVLLHAGIADRRMWDGQFAPLAGRFTAVRYDRRGFGRTRLEPGPFAHRRDLGQLLDGLGLERAALVGCSQGARISVDFALERPDRVAALVLVAPALGGFPWEEADAQVWAEIEAAELRGDVDAVNELELRVWVDGPRRGPDEVDPAVRELVRDMNRIALEAPGGVALEEELEPPAYGRLAEIAAPTLVVAGDFDTAQTLAVAEHLAGAIAGAERVMMSGVAHLPSLERPAEFNRIVLPFLERVASPAP